MNPGSNVKTPRSRVRCEMSRHSGPMVPASAFSGAVLPEERFFNSYFVPMLLPACHIDEARKPCTVDGMNQAHASHARAKRRRARSAPAARAGAASRELRRSRFGCGASTRARLGLGLLRGVLLAELVHATAGVHDFLLARVKRMAVGADLDLQVMTDGRAGL